MNSDVEQEKSETQISIICARLDMYYICKLIWMIAIIECDVKNLYRNSVSRIYMKVTIATKITGFELKSRSIAF